MTDATDSAPPFWLAKRQQKEFSGGQFPCPECGATLSAVIDSRPKKGRIKRRRSCPKGHRFSTIEMVIAENPDLDAKVLQNLINLTDEASYKLDIMRSVLTTLVNTDGD